MMDRGTWLVGVLACLLLGFAAVGEGVEAAEEVTLDVAEYEPEILEEEMAIVVTPADVWWGNRSIAYGNYIEFEKVDGCQGICKYCDQNNICCDTGCPCESCQYICDDCDDCPPSKWDKIFFDLDKAVLRPAGVIECDKILLYLRTFPEESVIIEGHCCDWASDAYNMDLGQRRAAAVATYLEDHGIDPSRMQMVTYGETLPWVPNDQRDLNRRAIVKPEPL